MSTTTTPPQRPNANNPDAWRTYWKSLDQSWRTEPEIDANRQKYLKECLTIVPDYKQGRYPFKDVALSRADVEWLLATHRDERGSVDLRASDLREVNLSGLVLRRAELRRAHLERAELRRAHLEGAYLRRAHLEGAYLRRAHLEGASLADAFLTSATDLWEIVLGNKQVGFVSLAGVHWGEVDLSVVDWTQVNVLGDEQQAGRLKGDDGKIKDAALRLFEYRIAVRANRQLAVALQGQGLSEEAAHFAYRAQLLQRVVLRRQGKVGRYLFSLLLDLLAGYGYRPGRSLIAYLLIIFGFMGLYLLNAHFVAPHLRWDEALVLSLSSFHGRGFFSQDISLGDTYARLAAAEAVVGLLIEVSLIATFTQRFLGK
jgi:hypothetical protein